MLPFQDTKLPADSTPAANTATTEVTATPLTPKPTNEAFSLWMWLPLVIAFGIWLYLRGRNQAAGRAQAATLASASAKKQKKSARPQLTEYNDVDASRTTSNVALERSSGGKGNSKKNKKDKLKKKQQAASVAASRKALATAAHSTVAVKKPTAAKSLAPTTSLTSPSTNAETKPIVVASSAAKAIFEPLRKLTLSNSVESDKLDTNESDDTQTSELQDNFPARRRRPATPPPVITTPAKVSSGRFEKLNVPPSSVNLMASSANRWPTDATRSLEPVRTAQPINAATLSSAAPTNMSNARPSAVDAPGLQTARGLSGFVKVNKAASATDAAKTVDSSPLENDPSNA